MTEIGRASLSHTNWSFYFMGKGLCLGLIAALILSARTLDAQLPNLSRGPAAYSPLVRAAFRALVSGPGQASGSWTAR
jgi:hypothetical protein